MLKVVLLLVVMVTGGVAEDEIEWSFQTFIGSNFSLLCNDSHLNVQSGSEYVTWRTPDQDDINKGMNTDLYDVRDVDNVAGLVLFVKKVNASTSGVYQCFVHQKSNAEVRTSTLRGINVHDRKYESMGEKYSNNIIIAVISTAVFIVPAATMMLLFVFRYQTSEDIEKRKARKAGLYRNPHQESQRYSEPEMTEKVKSPEGYGAYDNPVETDLSTQL